MDKTDLDSPWGLLVPKASTLAPSTGLLVPPPLHYDTGSLVIAVLPSLADPAIFEVYASNTTGAEPLASGHENIPVSLLRYTTTDFVHYSTPRVVLNVIGEGTPTMKCIARDNAGRYALMINKRDHDFISVDGGLSWAATNTTGMSLADKDDLNLIFNKGRFVDMQIAFQNWTLRYCDNDGCNRRRVVTAKTSIDGFTWSDDLGLITPDEEDAPELEFYRIRPFYVGNTTRLAAHVLNYATAPPQSIVGTAYGRQPEKCSSKITGGHGHNGSRCHAPHLYEEWWLGPASDDAADITGWRRPFRLTHAAPRDAFLMAQVGCKRSTRE
jgi:hypothetical protein